MRSAILLVDDEESVLSMLKLVLESKKNQVSTARSAQQAKAMLNAQSFDLVVTDMRMETDTAGFEVSAEARKQAYGPGVVILTAFPMLAKEWKSAGADAMLAKPVTMSELLRVVESVLQQRRRPARDTKPARP